MNESSPEVVAAQAELQIIGQGLEGWAAMYAHRANFPDDVKQLADATMARMMQIACTRGNQLLDTLAPVGG